MRKSLLVGYLLALSCGLVGCVAETDDPDLPQTALGSDMELEPDASPDSSDPESDPAAVPSNGVDAEPASPSNGADVEPHPMGAAIGTDGNDSELSYAGESLETHLQRLQDVGLFEVGELLTTLPGENYSCANNQPCPGEELDGVISAQHARLVGLLAIAEDVSETPELPQATQAAQDYLSAITSLSILRVGDLIVDQPANSGSCNNLPCQSDIDAADASNLRRVEELAAVAEQSVDL